MTLDSYKSMYSEIQKDAVVSTKWFFGCLLDGHRKWRHRAVAGMVRTSDSPIDDGTS
jgi:hypothetical protein